MESLLIVILFLALGCSQIALAENGDFHIAHIIVGVGCFVMAGAIALGKIARWLS